MPSFIIPPLPCLSPRRASTATTPICNATPPSEEPSFSPDWQVLQRRVTNLRAKEASLDRDIAHNWRNGIYKASVVASVGADYVRKLSVQGELLACGTASGGVVLSNLKTGMRVCCRDVHTGQVTAVDYGEGVVVTAGAGDKEVVIWGVAEYEKGEYWTGRFGEIEGEGGGGIRCKGHEDVVSGVKVFDGKVYSASVDGTVRVWDLSGKEVLNIRVGEAILAIKVTEKGYLLLGCASGRVLAYERERGVFLLSLICHANNVTAVDFWEETQLMVTGDSSGHMSVWSFNEAKKVGDLPSHDGAVLSVQMDGCKVVSASREGAVAVSVLDKMTRLYSIFGFTKYLACAAFDRTRLFADGTNDVIVCHHFD